jgi:predicted RNase H-like HicB family nuclease
VIRRFLEETLFGRSSARGTRASLVGRQRALRGSAEPSENADDARVHTNYSVSMQLTAAVTHEPPWYVARCLDVEVTSQGESLEEALENLREALELYFEDAPVPDSVEPPIIASVEVAA